ncbi:dihydroorotate dehydrogenase electron transfer subunit [Lacrimispora sp. NSJ-141]|uniref:Dihydroorotate dehydrogenase B (NAD(+)), electron transfer subunit n=1 Tax=Lientehia hominis TaxID=2897778 RepID=A0AAP2W932_9FIRM|nr:dihydroorotate dehydrogenase electron transfer subunit [Lientehia hominis]MCD2492821.1 dihydroorotate dehydrogenase electron transfer subunit [Lientehia hominis]
MAKRKESARVLSQESLAPGIYSMWIETDMAEEAGPGQFLSLYSKDGSRLLPRPISICEISKGRIRLVYRIAGKGTEEFSAYKAGDSIPVLGPLGNGFPLEAAENRRAFLIGGGIGVPPMLELAKKLPGEKKLIMGYRDSHIFLKEEFEQAGPLYVATEDGSFGTAGNVLDAIREHGLSADVLYACGPAPMLRALKDYASERGIEAWISLEERMACGVGACLACICRSKEVDSHSQVHNKRICKDGPVFRAEEVEL